MAPTGTVIKMFGVPEALKAFDELPRRVGFKHLRIALNAAGGEMKRTATAYAPKQTGLLRRSLGVKVKIPDASFNSAHHGSPAYVVIGPRRGFARNVFSSKRGKTKFLTDSKASQKSLQLSGGRSRVRNPARYAHLVEKGTRSHIVSVRSARVLSNGANTFGRRARVRAKPNRFIETTIVVAGPSAQAKAVAKLQQAALYEAQQLARV